MKPIDKLAFKQYHLSYLLSGSQKKRLKVIFRFYDLDRLKEYITKWQYIGLINDYGFYEKGEERKLLMNFCDNFLKIMEVFYIRSKQKTLKQFNRMTLLSREEIKNTNIVLDSFTNQYSIEYAKMELLDLLNVVISYNNGDVVNRSDILPFFITVNCLLELVYEKDK
ncbi:hypothetical protein ACDQ55_15200 [Chitinophaga sp. 30R24]|uniref:hypothetical protein n=1 Tax=Chitinophaga sp. 30R24 TaxID=3248838 RepID=UPI003B91FEDA